MVMGYILKMLTKILKGVRWAEDKVNKQILNHKMIKILSLNIE